MVTDYMALVPTISKEEKPLASLPIATPNLKNGFGAASLGNR